MLTMSLLWLWSVAACALVITNADRSPSGSSLRSALEALQRRQRGRGHAQPDYDAIYEYVAPEAYLDSDYGVDFDEDSPDPYLLKLLDDKDRPREAYEYKIIKKSIRAPVKKASAFRERSHHNDKDRLKDFFADRGESDKREFRQRNENSEEEYEELLRQLWSKYKNNKHQGNNIETAPQGIVKLYKEKQITKRYPNNWGPVAFKRKRSSGDEPQGGRKPHEDRMPVDPIYNSYDLTDENKDDIKEEYDIVFQPLDDDESFPDLSDDERNTYDNIGKRFPVAKRSAAPININRQTKRHAQNQNHKKSIKTFRTSSGTDPNIKKELSKIFGDSESDLIKSPVKRSTNDEEHSHDDYKPPQVIVMSHDNVTQHSHNSSYVIDDNSHELHGHIHHPGMGSEQEVTQSPTNKDKPLAISKKSIKWSDYFGIDKRQPKSYSFVNNLNQDRFRKQYLDTFNSEVILPLHTFGKQKKVKRSSINNNINKSNLNLKPKAQTIKRKRDVQETEAKLDDMDKRLKNMEGLIVDEALHLSEAGEDLDTKEEQDMKEKMLSRMAAAHSLEKMRKALKEFKQSLVIQKHEDDSKQSRDSKVKRVAVKKEKVDTMSNEIPRMSETHDNTDDFEDEQGAGHYLDGNIDKQFSEGYMGGSGRHRIPVISTAEPAGSCPVLNKIIQRCRGVDMLAGDRGQLFLPLCSLHQICYLCGDVPPTTCDLVFLSEADTICEGDMGCQQAARAVLMTLRDLHDNLTDELDGECEASPCLTATLKLNGNWQRALKR